MSRVRSLTIQEEQRLATRIADRDVAARNALALAHLGVIRGLVGRFPEWPVDRQEMDQEAFLAVLDAAWAFRPGTGRFLARAVRAILRAVRTARKRETRRLARQEGVESARDVAAPDVRADESAALRGAIATELVEDERAAVRSRYRIGVARASLTRSTRRLASSAVLRKLKPALATGEAE